MPASLACSVFARFSALRRTIAEQQRRQTAYQLSAPPISTVHKMSLEECTYPSRYFTLISQGSSNRCKLFGQNSIDIYKTSGVFLFIGDNSE